MLKHHNLSVHEYIITDYILKGDVVINVPKFKTHQKGGITVAMKNMVGINASKDCLHHTLGARNEDGDEYQFADIRKTIRAKLADTIEITKNPMKRYFANIGILALAALKRLSRTKIHTQKAVGRVTTQYGGPYWI